MSICHNVQFFIRSKTNISNVAIKEKKKRNDILQWKYQLIWAWHSSLAIHNQHWQRINCMALSPWSFFICCIFLCCLCYHIIWWIKMNSSENWICKSCVEPSCPNRLERSAARITLCWFRFATKKHLYELAIYKMITWLSSLSRFVLFSRRLKERNQMHIMNEWTV